jgi:hypothetical protein
MTDILECETDELYDGCETVYEAFYRIKRESETLLVQMEQLAKLWEGPANRLFQSFYLTDCDRLIQLCGYVEDLGEYLQRCGESYRYCDQVILAGVQL